jgi:hypothetical protein
MEFFNTHQKKHKIHGRIYGTRIYFQPVIHAPQLRHASHHVVIGCNQQNFRNIVFLYPFIDFLRVLFGILSLFSQNNIHVSDRFFGQNIMQHRSFVNSGYKNIFRFARFRQSESAGNAIAPSGKHHYVIKTGVIVVFV